MNMYFCPHYKLCTSFFFNLTEESAAFNQEWQHKAREAQLLQHSLEYPQRRHSGRGQEPQLALPE